MARNAPTKRAATTLGKREVIIILWFTSLESKWNNAFHTVWASMFFAPYNTESITVNKINTGAIHKMVTGTAFVFCISFNAPYLLYYLDKFFTASFKNAVLLKLYHLVPLDPQRLQILSFLSQHSYFCQIGLLSISSSTFGFYFQLFHIVRKYNLGLVQQVFKWNFLLCFYSFQLFWNS